MSTIRLKKFYQGFSPLFYTGTTNNIGNIESANDMLNINLFNPSHITQGYGNVEVDTSLELINFILDKTVTTDKTYALGTNLYELQPSSLTNIRVISGAVTGRGLDVLDGNLYYFYDTASEGRIGSFDLSSTYNDSFATGLQKGLKSTATKQWWMLFGHGRYVGYRNANTSTTNLTFLDFGEGSEVADIVFHQNNFYIAVNSTNLGDNNRSRGQIFTLSAYNLENGRTFLDGEIAVGQQRIGFLHEMNGVVYVAHQDLGSDNYKISYIQGTRLANIGTFTGTLPLYNQKTLFKNTVIFLSSGKIWSNGATDDNLPIQTSIIGSADYSTTLGALAAPFGTPLVSSSDGATFKLSKLEGYTTNSYWLSLVQDLLSGSGEGNITSMVVYTEPFEEGGRADVTIYANNQDKSATLEVSDHTKTKFTLNNKLNRAKDIQVKIDFSNGSTTYPVKIRQIDIELSSMLQRNGNK